MAKFRAGIFKQRTYNQIGVYLNKLKKEMKPSQARQTNLQILKRAITILKDNFKNEKQGDGTKMKRNKSTSYPQNNDRTDWGGYAQDYSEWKRRAQMNGWFIPSAQRHASPPFKVMRLTGNASTVPPAGKKNFAFRTEASQNGIYIESTVKSDKGFEYGKWQTLNGRDFMPSVKAVRKIALEIYERKFNKVKPR